MKSVGSFLTENTVFVCCNDQPVNGVQVDNQCLYLDLYKIHKYILTAKFQFANV